MHLELEAAAARIIAKYPALSERVLKGLRLAKNPAAVRQPSPGVFEVASSTGWVVVLRSPRRCGCPDHKSGRAIACKHQISVDLLAMVGALPEAPRSISNGQRAL